MNSETITQRIWQHSKATGASKLILLALAQHADVDGFCWPGYETLGDMVGLTKRNAMRNLAPSIESGEVMVWEQQGQHGGRGYTNLYLITVGLTSDQIREIVKRRFELQADEVDTVLSKKGDEYITLCYLKRVSNETLLRTRDAKKGDKIDTLNGRMSDKVDTLNQQKGDKNITRTIESKPIESNLDSAPNGISDKPPPNGSPPGKIDGKLKQEMVYKLSQICKINLGRASGKQKGQLGTAAELLIKTGVSPPQLDGFIKRWYANDWRGVKGQVPEPHQVCEEWDRMEDPLQSGKNVLSIS
jgi:hypothetical protein